MIPHDEYLTNEVLTATPQRLHLMLIDAALRHCERTRQFWNAGLEEHATEALSKVQDIISELLASLNYSQQPKLAGQMAGIYNFIFRAIINASLKRDPQSLNDAQRILEIERETWREVVRRTTDSAGISTRKHAAHGAPAPMAIAEVPASSFSAHA